MHALHTPDEGFPEEEKKEREEKRVKKNARCCAALRRTAPHRVATDRKTAPSVDRPLTRLLVSSAMPLLPPLPGRY